VLGAIGGNAFDRNRIFLYLVSPITMGIVLLSNMGVLMLFRNGRRFAGSIIALVLMAASEIIVAIVSIPIAMLF